MEPTLPFPFTERNSNLSSVSSSRLLRLPIPIQSRRGFSHRASGVRSDEAAVRKGSPALLLLCIIDLVWSSLNISDDTPDHTCLVQLNRYVMGVIFFFPLVAIAVYESAIAPSKRFQQLFPDKSVLLPHPSQQSLSLS